LPVVDQFTGNENGEGKNEQGYGDRYKNPAVTKMIEAPSKTGSGIITSPAMLSRAPLPLVFPERSHRRAGVHEKAQQV
jgi:hypothetical protein